MCFAATQKSLTCCGIFFEQTIRIFGPHKVAGLPQVLVSCREFLFAAEMFLMFATCVGLLGSNFSMYVDHFRCIFESENSCYDAAEVAKVVPFKKHSKQRLLHFPFFLLPRFPFLNY